MQDEPDQLSAPLGMMPPLAFTWAQLIDQLASERGGLAELARHLQDTAPAQARLADDPMTVERGLRRLRSRGNGAGNKYGRWLLRCYGIPRPIAAWAREMGQYHSRTSDLPVSLRRDQLRLWDCPPVSESSDAVWVHLGLAMLAHREGDMAQVERQAELAHLTLAPEQPEAQLEWWLLQARLASDRGAQAEALAALAQVGDALAGGVVSSPDERACYLARWRDQRAYLGSRQWRADPAQLDWALEQYSAIEPTHPFAAFRRAHGRAWCLWRQGHRAEALVEATQASQHAGDGGYIRLRVMSLTLRANILGPSGEGRALLTRAEQMAARMGDQALLTRVRAFLAAP